MPQSPDHRHSRVSGPPSNDDRALVRAARRQATEGSQTDWSQSSDSLQESLKLRPEWAQKAHDQTVTPDPTGRSGDGGPPLIGPGTIVGNYRLVQQIGVGGMGEVFLAVHSRFKSRLFAIKFVKDEVLNEKQRARFEAEINVMENLSHPNIVYAQDAGTFENTSFLVMEFVQGPELRTVVIEQAPLRVADAAEIIRQAAFGVAHAAKHGIVHRDIKPSNLMLTADGVVKLLDLGLARLRAKETTELTEVGQILGSPDYMSPEQWENTRDVDVRADIYSLGCTLYSLLVGHAPFEDEQHSTLGSKLKAHLEEQPRRLSDLSTTNVPNELVQIVDKMLAKSPDDRYQTPEELIAALEPFCAGSDLAAVAERAGSGELDLAQMLSNLPPAANANQETRSILEPGVETDSKIPFAPQRPGPVETPRSRRNLLPAIWLSALVLVVAAVAFFFWPRSELAPVQADLTIDYFRQLDRNEPLRTPGAKLKPYDLNQQGFAEFGDLVQIRADLSTPCYAYLVALNPTASENGIQLCWPEDPATPPALTESIVYPPKKTSFVPLNDGEGQQVFLLIYSGQPLPAFDQWEPLLAANWDVNQQPGIWKYAGGQLQQVFEEERTRGNVVDFSALILEDTIRAILSRDEAVSVNAIAFPVTRIEDVPE